MQVLSSQGRVIFCLIVVVVVVEGVEGLDEAGAALAVEEEVEEEDDLDMLLFMVANLYVANVLRSVVRLHIINL